MQYLLEIVKYNRETNASIEARFRDNNVGVIIHAKSFGVTEIEIEAAKENSNAIFFQTDNQNDF